MMIGKIRSAPEVDVFGFAFSSDGAGDGALDVGGCKVKTDSDIASSSLLASDSSVWVGSVRTSSGTPVVAIVRRA